MEKITYEDKEVYRRLSTDIPNKQQVTADDLNEIKQVVNSNADISIDKEVDNLTNYYKKTESYSKAEIDNKNFINKDVNDLTNYYKKTQTYSKTEVDNKGYITGSQVPTYETQPDWNATSGKGQILNKPTIPPAQVNADWNATSGKARILNKPTIPAPYNLPVASVYTLGGIKERGGLSQNNGYTLSAAGMFSLLYAENDTQYGIVKLKELNNGLELKAEGNLSLLPATTTTLGGIKVGNNLSITADGTLNATGGGGGSFNIDMVYPVGSIYMTVNNTDPATLFAGTTWARIKDMFLLGAGDTFGAGTTGGSIHLEKHTHSIPSLSGTATGGAHHHLVTTRTASYAVGQQTNWRCMSFVGTQSDYGQNVYSNNGYDDSPHDHPLTTEANITGETGDNPTNNMPPYLAVYIWKRTA